MSERYDIIPAPPAPLADAGAVSNRAAVVHLVSGGE
jgi:hypothetical protein